MGEQQKGFIPVMLTPFTETGEIDYPALDELIAFYLQAGAAGLFANCQSSEMFSLSTTESLSLIAHVIRAVDGRVPVVAACSKAGSIEEQALVVKQIYALGVEAVILITGLLVAEHESDAVFNSHVDKLFALTDHIPLGFYECPEPYKRVLRAEQLGAYVASGRVIYHKDTSLDITQVRAKIAATRGTSFGLYDAYMVHAVASLKAGAAGLSCIQGNYFPELIVWLCRHFDNKDLEDETESVQRFLIAHMEVMHAIYPVSAKYFLQKRGLHLSLRTRREVGVWDRHAQLAVDQLFEDYVLLANRLHLENKIIYRR